MPHSTDLHDFQFVVDAVNDAVRANNDLANAGITELRNDATDLGELVQLVSLSYEAIPERLCPRTAIACNERDKLEDRHVPSEPRSACKPCGQLFLDLFMRYTFTAVQLAESLLNGGHQLNPISNFVQRSVVRELLERGEHHLFLSHRDSISAA